MRRRSVGEVVVGLVRHVFSHVQKKGEGGCEWIGEAWIQPFPEEGQGRLWGDW